MTALFPRSKSEDAEEVYDLDNEDVGFKSLNVRVSVYKQIKRIAKEDNRTIAGYSCFDGSRYFKSRAIICGDNCGCPEPCEEQLDRLEEQNRIFGGN